MSDQNTTTAPGVWYLRDRSGDMYEVQPDGSAARVPEAPVIQGVVEETGRQTAHQIDEQYWPEPGEVCTRADHQHEVDREAGA
jgi:hypothetical protein